MGLSREMGLLPVNGWFISTKMDDLGIPHDLGNHQIKVCPQFSGRGLRVSRIILAKGLTCSAMQNAFPQAVVSQFPVLQCFGFGLQVFWQDTSWLGLNLNYHYLYPG
jgi:hypothetical protein